MHSVYGRSSSKISGLAQTRVYEYKVPLPLKSIQASRSERQLGQTTLGGKVIPPHALQRVVTNFSSLSASQNGRAVSLIRGGNGSAVSLCRERATAIPLLQRRVRERRCSCPAHNWSFRVRRSLPDAPRHLREAGRRSLGRYTRESPSVGDL